MDSDNDSDNNCESTIKKNSDMDDILIVYFKNSEIVKLWVDYISSYFKQPEERPIYRKPFKVQHLGIEDIVDANGDIRYIAERTAGVKLQLVIICPNFLEQLSSNPNPASALGKILLPDRTLALLLGVTEDDVKDEHKIVFPHYSQWQRSAVGQDQDESFTKEFLTTAMGILLKVWKQQSSIINQEKALFSVSPKKIRQGQSAFIIMLTYPLQKEDVIKISIERNNELTEIKSVKRRNPYTLKVIVPDVLTEISAIVHVLVEKNGTIIGMRPIKCESRLRELEQILRSVTSPVEFMCQTLGFNPQNKEQLDNYLVHALQKNLPPNFNLLNNHTNINFNHHDHKFGMTKEFPTLLHFAAKFGLEKLAMQLLDCPGGDVACEIRNSNEMIPAEIASDAGHVNLSHILKGYMKMNELTSMYAKLKEIKQEVEKPAGEATDLHYSSPNECYKICPPPRPVNPINVVATPSPTSENPPNQICGYLAMNSTPQIKVDVQQKEQKFAPRTKCSQESINTSHSRATSPILQTTHKHHNNNSNNSSSNNNKPKTPDTFEDKVQEELREILNDCKNNVHSIAQTEKLVEQWKNRNDVQKSFKEKQEQLDQMRMEYEKIQQEMKRVHKTTPFERLKKLFGRNGSKQGKEDEASTPTTEVGSVSSNRPISSLSLQSTSSSGSSGRISTISGCSMGDSGTHSDHDDRKITTPIEEDFRSGLNKLLGMNNYHIPPSPKPIKMPNKYPVIEERPPQPTPRPETDQYYIHFPRSGKPIANNVIPEKPAEESEYLDLEGDSRKQSSKMTSSSSASQPLLYAEEYMNVPSKLPQVIQRNAENAPLYMNLHH